MMADEPIDPTELEKFTMQLRLLELRVRLTYDAVWYVGMLLVLVIFSASITTLIMIGSVLERLPIK